MPRKLAEIEYESETEKSNNNKKTEITKAKRKKYDPMNDSTEQNKFIIS